MKKLLPFLLPLTLSASDIQIELHSSTVHMNGVEYTKHDTDLGHKYNSKTFGLGVIYNNYSFGYLKNSYFKDSFYIGYNYTLFNINNFSLDSRLFFISGYTNLPPNWKYSKETYKKSIIEVGEFLLNTDLSLKYSINNDLKLELSSDVLTSNLRTLGSDYYVHSSFIFEF